MNNPPPLFDRQHIASNLARGGENGPDFVTRLVLNDLADRLGVISRRFDKALILAPDTRHLPERLVTADAEVEFTHIPTLVAQDGEIPADPENLKLPEQQYDLIVSLFDLAITNDVPGFLGAIHRHLRADGLMIAAFVGGTSFNELRSAWLRADSEHLGGAVARIAPFIDTRDAGGLLQRTGYALPVADIEPLTLRYASALDLMREIRELGAANPLTQRHHGLLTPRHLETVMRAYQDIAGDADGRVRATLELIWLSGWAPHESQQKPLKPGSAELSLKDVLKSGKN